jgi:deltex-like protein
MLLASAVVVWEWLNEHGRWRPYSPAVSHHIEAVIRNDPRGGSVVLGQVDTRLSPYIVDLHSMHQFRQDTGKTNVIDNRDIAPICIEGFLNWP